MVWIPRHTPRPPMVNQHSLNLGMERSERLKNKVVAESGLTPGRYTDPEALDYKPLVYVKDALIENIEKEIDGVDVVDLCSRLYYRHEIVISSRAIVKGPDALLAQALRSLMELAVQTCDPTEVQVDERHCDYVVALALQAVGWDHIWDQYVAQLLPQEIVVEEDYTLRPIPHEGAMRAYEGYMRYMSDRQRVHEIYQDDALAPPTSGAIEDWFKVAVDISELDRLDRCLTTEVGYGFHDYLTFIRTLLEILDADGMDVGVFDCSVFPQDCSSRHGLRKSVTGALLRDFSLSKGVIRDVAVGDIFTIGRRKRDTRFMRRPILQLSWGGRSVLLYGYSSVLQAAEMLHKQVGFGRIPVDLWRNNPNVRSAFGEIQGKVGEPLKQSIAKDCKKMFGEDHVFTEKGSISGVKSDDDLGAVDIFIVDRLRRRFILAEVKNSASTGTDPLAMKDERHEFMDDFLPVLNQKANWFLSNIAELKREWGISSKEDYTVEEVVVVNQQRPWVLTSEDRMPIMDDEEFLAKLGRGDVLLNDPLVGTR